MTTFKRSRRLSYNFMPSNIRCEKISREVFHTHEIPLPPASKSYIIWHETTRWCTFHNVKGNHAEYFYQLKKEIEHLIQEVYLKKYVKGGSTQTLDGSRYQRWYASRSSIPKKGKEPSNINKYRLVHHIINTISRGLLKYISLWSVITIVLIC